MLMLQRIFPNNIFVKSMEPPLEREGKGGKVSVQKAKKSSFEQRLQLTRTVFQLFSFFKKQAPVCKINQTEFVASVQLLNELKRSNTLRC